MLGPEIWDWRGMPTILGVNIFWGGGGAEMLERQGPKKLANQNS